MPSKNPSLDAIPFQTDARADALKELYEQELRGPSHDLRRLWQILVLLTMSEEDRLAYSDAYGFGQKALALAQKLNIGPRIENACILVLMARIDILRSRNSQALTLLFRAQAIADALSDLPPDLLCHIHMFTGMAHSYSSQYEPARFNLETAIRIAREHLEPMGRAERQALISLANVHILLKQPGLAITALNPLFEHLMAAFPEHDHQFGYVVSELADANRMLGYHDHAANLLRRAIKQIETVLGPDDSSLNTLEKQLALCLLRANQPSEALAQLTNLLPKLARQHGKYSTFYIHTLTTIADALLCLGQRREAIRASTQARALARRHLPRKDARRVYAKTVNQIACKGARLTGLMAKIKAAVNHF